MSELPIAFRPANSGDLDYIYKTWFMEFRKTHPNNHMPSKVYLDYQGPMIHKCLHDAPTIIACMDDEPTQIIGYLTAKPLHGDSILIHYGFVKNWARRMEVMKQLLNQFNYEGKSLVCTHFFKLFPDLKEKYKLIYDPTLLQDLPDAT